MSNLIYLDAISAVPPWSETIAAMHPFLTEAWGNPLSPHVAGDRPNQAVEHARDQVAALVGADPSEVVFTASGSEANNLAVKGLAEAAAVRHRRHLVISAVEHPSITGSCRALEARGFTTTVLPVDSTGRVDPDRVQSELTAQTALVSIQAASGEIGTLQPLAEIGAVTRRAGVPFHVDAVVAAGRIPLDTAALRVDAMSLSSNQLGGPSGAGALIVRRGIRLEPLIHGGTQERGRRAGLEHVPGIVGMGVAAELTRVELPSLISRVTPLMARLRDGLLKTLDGCRMTGHPMVRLPGHLSLAVEFVEGEALVMALSRDGIAAAAGVTCRERTAWKASPALLALGLEQSLAQGAVVFSLWRGNTPEEIDRAIQLIARHVSHLRALSPIYAARVPRDPPVPRVPRVPRVR
ncbi:MAG TPA: cysteine desulfurase family protein [Nitrospiria bacterium]|nr:cysteine desulfurase family protein [Nitrospiria bacterium]